MISLAWKHEHVYIDTSAYLPRYYPPQLIHFMNTYGSDKVLFGTNFPMLALETCGKARALPLKPATKAKFLRKCNAGVQAGFVNGVPTRMLIPPAAK